MAKLNMSLQSSNEPWTQALLSVSGLKSLALMMWKPETKEEKEMTEKDLKPLSARSDGSSADYYLLPKNAAQLQDLISHRNMNAQIGEIFRACYRYGIASHSDQLRDAKKILFYAHSEVKRLEREAELEKEETQKPLRYEAMEELTQEGQAQGFYDPKVLAQFFPGEIAYLAELAPFINRNARLNENLGTWGISLLSLSNHLKSRGYLIHDLPTFVRRHYPMLRQEP